MFQKLLSIILLLSAFAALTLFPPARIAHAGGVVTDCADDADLSNKLAGGGTVTFNCGTATIVLRSSILISASTTINGGSKITLSGAKKVRLFTVSSAVTLTLKNITLEDGYSANDHGGAIVNSGHLILDHATLQRSYTPYAGGAIYTLGPVEITNSTLAYNISTSGAAIYAESPTTQLTITNSTFHHNDARITSFGGAIYMTGPLEITNSEFSYNTAGSGSAVYASRTQGTTLATIRGSTFHHNQAPGDYPNGGTVFVSNVPTTISDSIFRNNGAQSGGAVGVGTAGQVFITNSVLRDNSATNGGGIYNQGVTAVSNTTLSGNDASHGGGIVNLNTLVLANVTLSGNNATYGSALKNEHGSAALTNVTLAENGANSTGYAALMSTDPSGSALYLKNVLIAGVQGRDNCYYAQAPSMSEFNLSSDSTCNFGAGHDSVALRLGPLANNGGLTQTHLPQPGSPAINGGTSSNAPSTDQRGFTRIGQGTAYDVGAVEVQNPLPTPTRTATPTRTPTKTATPTSCAGKPAKPILTKPINGAPVARARVKLDWQTVFCADTYRVEVRQSSQTGRLVDSSTRLTVSKYKTEPLPRNKTFFWQVLACHGRICSKPAWGSFSTK